MLPITIIILFDSAIMLLDIGIAIEKNLVAYLTKCLVTVMGIIGHLALNVLLHFYDKSIKGIKTR